MSRYIFVRAMTGLALALCAACASHRHGPSFDSTVQQRSDTRAAVDAGDPQMFDPQTYLSLVAENKAIKQGDVLTVIVQEFASAASTADQRTQRSFDVSGKAGSSSKEPHSAAAGLASDGDGMGRTGRSGKLLAQLSVRVIAVNPNGDLTVSGQQNLRINGEEQLITLTGTVRPRDIADNNTVLSSRIADAYIRFDGAGFVTDQSRPGWLARIFTWLGL
jgi:flagellar L-ring protein precursor FlgH